MMDTCPSMTAIHHPPDRIRNAGAMRQDVITGEMGILPTPLYYNEDSTDFFFHVDHAAGQGGAHLDAYIDRIAAGGVTTFLCNTNAQRTNYASDVWTPTWEGFDPGGPDDQPYLSGISSTTQPVDVSGWRRLATNMLALHEEGVDYPARVIDRCRLRGMSPWITLRMNDVHDQLNEAHPIHGRFWLENQHLWRQRCDGYYSRAFDFGHAEVRDYYMALVDETLDRYDVDGLELDFLREPYLFSVGEEDQGRDEGEDSRSETLGIHELSSTGRRHGRMRRVNRRH